MEIDRLIAFYQELTPGQVERFPEFYGPDAYFKDPFNEVSGIEAIQQIFAQMFRQTDAPRFVVTERVADADCAILIWEFHYRLRRSGRAEERLIRGVSHLKFGADGKVSYHRDYWDTAEELYMKLPVIGSLMRGMRKMLAARKP